MINSNRIGRLTNAPVVYVLAQIRFSAITKLGEKYIPNIQERLRRDYPRFQHVQTQEVTVPMAASGQLVQVVTNPRWDFSDRANRSGFVVLENAVTYHTTDYTTFDECLEKLHAGLAQIQEELHIALTSRVGIRYIDLIAPDEGEQLDQYVTGSLLGFPLGKISPNPGRQQTVATTKTTEGVLTLRFCQDQSNVILPPDLADHTLAPCRAHPPDRPKAILDTDHYSLVDTEFTVDDVASRLVRLHDVSSEAFKTIVTDYAWNKWR